MPGGDGTGPLGAGPMTGRGAGYCAGYGVPGYANPTFGRGLGRGFGRGFGRGRRFGCWGGMGWYGAPPREGWAFAYPVPYAPSVPPPVPDPEIEKRVLKNRTELLQSELEFLRKRLEELEKTSETE